MANSTAHAYSNMGGRWHKNRGGGHNKNQGGGTISECYKSGGTPMVKIKDFTLASKNLGGCARAPHAQTPAILNFKQKQ